MISASFFLCFFLYVWLVVEPAFFFHNLFLRTYPWQNDFPVFYTGWEFSKKYLSIPGGPIEYLSALLSQSFFSSFFGALSITFVATLTCYYTAKCFEYFKIRIGAIFIFVPALLQIVTYNRYLHMMQVFLSILIALFSVVVFFKLSPKNASLRMIVFFVITSILYYLLGGACLIFIFLAALHEIFVLRRFYSGALLFFGFLIPMLVGVVFFGLSKTAAYLSMTPFYWGAKIENVTDYSLIATQCLFVFVPVTILISVLFKGMVPKRLLSFLENKAAATTVHVFLLFILGGLAVHYSSDPAKKFLCTIEYLHRNKKWSDILQLVEKSQADYYTPATIYCINRALYETGQLGDLMMRYPQDPKSLFARRSHRYLEIDFNYELGNFNYAEKTAVDALEKTNFSPVILEKFAKIEIAKGQTRVAKVILNSLSKNLVFGKRARMLLEHLDKNTPSLNTNKQSPLLNKGHTFNRQNYNFILPELLKTDPQNKMAFEYMQAYYLLNKRLKKFIENLKYLKGLGYERIPTHYQEAVIVYEGLTKEPVNLGDYIIDPEVRQRGKKLTRTFNMLMPDKKAAYDTLIKEFGGSYYFYFIFGVSGLAQ
jgi:hypothetical protein